jgi:hypothetical protein
MQKFNPGNTEWFSSGTLVNSRQGAAAASTDTGFVFVAGGADTGMTILNDNESFMPGENHYRVEPSLPSVRAWASGFGLGERAYFLGGTNGGVFLDEVIEYEPVSGTYRQRIPYPFGVIKAGAVATEDGKVYVSGGAGNFGPASRLVYEGSVVDAFPYSGRVGLMWGFDKGTYNLNAVSIYRSTYVFENMSGNMGPAKATVPASTSVWNDTDVTPGRVYLYLVEASDVRGHKTEAMGWSAMPVTAPANLTVHAGNNQVLVEWDPVPDYELQGIDHYEVYRTTYPGLDTYYPQGQVVGGAGPTQGSCIDTNAMNGTGYYYVVRSVSLVIGAGLPSNVGSATPFAIAPPSAPSTLVASGQPDQTVTLQWQQALPGAYQVSGYRVYRSTGPTMDPLNGGKVIMEMKLPFPAWQASSTITIQVTDQNAPMDEVRNYQYKVVAFDQWIPATESNPSNLATATPGPVSWRMARGDAFTTGRNPSARGLFNGAALYWSYDTGATVWCEPVTGINGDVYFTSGNKVYRLSKAGGLLGSQVLHGAAVATKSGALLTYSNGSLSAGYAGFKLSSGGGAVARFNPLSLAIDWTVTMPGQLGIPLIALPDGRIVAGDDNGNLWAINPDGTVQWSRSFPGRIYGLSLIGSAGDGIAVLCGNWKGYGVETDTGLPMGAIQFSGTPTGWINDIVRREHLITLLDGTLMILSDEGMMPTWTRTTGGSFPSGMAMMHGTYVAAANTNQNFYWFGQGDPGNSFGWLAMPAPSLGGLSIGQSGGSYWGDEKGSLWYGPPQSMEAFPTPVPEGGAMGLSSPAVYDDGSNTFVLIGSRNHRLYSFINSTGVPPSATVIVNGPNIDLSWTPSGNTAYRSVSRYHVYRSTCLACSYAFSTTTWGLWATSYKDSTVVNPGVYSYRIGSVDDSMYSNLSVLSNPVSAAFGTVPAPESLTVLAEESRHIILMWSKPSSGYDLVSGYEIFRSTGHDGPYSHAGYRVGVSATAWYDAPLTNGVPLWYEVRSFGIDGSSGPFSSTVTGTPFEPPAPYVMNWERYSSLMNGRWGHRMESVGDYLYVFGGENGSGQVAAMERTRVVSPRYPLVGGEQENPTYYNWQFVSTSGTFENRRYFGSVVYNGRIYAAGGYNTGSGYQNNVRIFDPTTSTWVLENGGGFQGYEGTGLGVEQVFGKLFTQYGETGGGETTMFQSHAFGSPLPWNFYGMGGTPRAYQGFVSMPFSSFSFGGENGGIQLTDVTEYLPISGNYGATHPGLPVALERVSAARLGERMYVVGGWNGSLALNNVREYDPATYTWRDRISFPDSGKFGMAMVEMDGKLVLTGGRTGWASPDGRSEMFVGEPMHAVPGTNSASLMWGFDQGTYALANYTIYRATYSANGPSEAGAPIATGIAPATSMFDDNTVTNGNFYMYYVEASDVKGHKSWVWDMARVPPSAPTGTTALAGSGSVLVSWNKLPNADAENVRSYSIYRSTCGGEFNENMWYGTWQQVGWDNGATGQYIDRGLVNGTLYYYLVRAHSDYCELGPPSATAYAVPQYIAPPSDPSGFVVSSGKDQTVMLSWNDSTGGGSTALSGYWIFRTTRTDVTPMQSGSMVGRIMYPLAGPSPQLLDQTASAAFGRTYRYSVVAYDDWNPATLSGESIVQAATGVQGGWKSPRGDPFGTGRSTFADGLTTSLALKFAYPAGGTIYCTPAVSAGGTIYFTASDGYFYAITADGTLINKTALAGAMNGTESSPVIAYADANGTVDRVYVGSGSGAAGRLQAFKEDGTLAWSQAMTAPVDVAPVVTTEGDVIAYDRVGAIRRYDRTGTLVWSLTVGGKPAGNPLIAGNMLLLGSNSGWIFGINVFDGTFQGGKYISATVTGCVWDERDETLYGATTDGMLFSGPKDGPGWSATVNGKVYGAPLFDPTRGLLVVGTENGYACGTVLGGFPDGTNVGAPIRGSPVMSLGGTIYFADDAGVMHEWDSDGNEISTYKTPGGSAFGTASPALWKDGMNKTHVFIGSTSTRMYAFVNAPRKANGLTALPFAGHVRVSWLPAGGGYFPTSGYHVYRSTCATCPETLVGISIGMFNTAYSDTGAGAYKSYYYSVRTYDDSQFLNEGLPALRVGLTTTASGMANLALKGKRVDPFYAAAGEAQFFQFTFSNGGSATLYNVTITANPGSLDTRAYLNPSFSATVYGGGVVSSIGWFDGANWAEGEPANLTSGSAVQMRWVISSLPPGKSGYISYQAQMQAGADQARDAWASATMSIDSLGVSNFTIQYTATATAWRIASPALALKIFSAPYNYDDVGTAISIGTDGKPMFVGNQQDNGGMFDWRMSLWDGDVRAMLSSTIYKGAVNLDEANDSAVDSSGIFYVAGFESKAGVLQDWRVARYDPTLSSVLSSTGYNGPNNSTDKAYAVVLDQSGNVIVGGFESNTAGNGGTNWKIVKYNPALTAIIAATSWTGAGNNIDEVRSLAVDSQGNIIAGGVTHNGLQYYWRIAKYNSDFTQEMGSTVYNATSNGFFSKLAVDRNDNVYAVGYEDLWPNWRIWKYSPSLNRVLGGVTYSSAGNATDKAYTAAIDRDDNLVVGGDFLNGANIDWKVRKYDSALNLLDDYSRTNPLGTGVDSITGMAIAGTSTIFITGREYDTGENINILMGKVALAESIVPPGAPSGLTVTAYDSHIGLQWNTASAGSRAVAGYRVYRQTWAGVDQGSWLADVAGDTTSTFNDSTVVPGVAYFYRVVAYDGMGVDSRLSMEDGETGTVVLSLTVVSSTSYDFGAITGGSINVSNTTFDIQNSGNVTETLSLSVTNTAGTWQYTNDGSAGFNEYELDAQFNFPDKPASWTAADHALPVAPPGPDASTATRFAGNETGMALATGGKRHLWVRLHAPSSTSDAGLQKFKISVTAQTP